MRARAALLLALLALPACLAGGASVVAGLLPGSGATTGPSLLLSAEDGTECATFDRAPGIMVTAAHCATSDRYTLSDDRTATLLRRGAIAGLGELLWNCHIRETPPPIETKAVPSGEA